MQPSRGSSRPNRGSVGQLCCVGSAIIRELSGGASLRLKNSSRRVSSCLAIGNSVFYFSLNVSLIEHGEKNPLPKSTSL